MLPILTDGVRAGVFTLTGVAGMATGRLHHRRPASPPAAGFTTGG
jgi:hypothetical protein